MDYLLTKTDCVSVPETFMGTYFRETLYNNVEHCFLNEAPMYDKGDFVFHCFTVIKNDKSRDYYEEMEPGETIYVVFEEKTGYLESNSNRLFLELFREKGIDEADLAKENDYCKSYMLYLEEYISLV